MEKELKELSELKSRLAEINDFDKASSVLYWDQATYMPAGGVDARARQLATLGRLVQEKQTDPAIGHLLDSLMPYAEGLPYDSDEASLVRVARRDYEQAIKVPPKFMGDFYSHTAQTYQAWTEARPTNDFARLRPMLEKTLDMSRQLADFFPGYDHIADPLIDFHDYGMKAASISSLFAELRKHLVPLVHAITAHVPSDDSCLRKYFPKEQQLTLSQEIIKHLGYDLKRGRMDLTHHPFEIRIAYGDVRITTRVKEDFLGECLYSAIHESGHAMYEQGVAQALDGSSLAGGTSSGMHESQSRLWENLVGRSLEFCEFVYPKLQESFPEQLGNVGMNSFYKAINKVERSLIRTDADEVTYNLHVMLRFDFELAMLEGKLEIKDLPDAWQERYRADFGIAAPDDRDGVLQDVHWYSGMIGGNFQGYTLGNILSALFYEAALRAHPEIPSDIRIGKFETLHSWLRENIYSHGRKFTANEVVERISGGSIRIEPYIDYLKTKYGRLYQL